MGNNMSIFSIATENTPPKYVEGLILGLVFSGYSTYLDFDTKSVCFIGHNEEVINPLDDKNAPFNMN